MLPLSKQSLLLDIETSGLSRENDQVISIGIAYLTSTHTLETKHWFLEKDKKEEDLLLSFLSYIEAYETLYTYKGKSFDYPFLLSRFHFYGIEPTNFLKLKLVDCQLVLKAFSTHRSTLEELSHFTRQSQSDGRDIVKLFKTYSATQGEIYKTLILNHQKDELNSLYYLYEVYQVLYHLSQYTVLEQTRSENKLTLKLKSPWDFISSFEGTYESVDFKWSSHTDSLTLSLPLVNTTLKQWLTPLKDYYYIPAQSQLIHRSLAQFIPKDQKRHATKEECFITQEGIYLRMFTTYQLNLPTWYDDLKKPYILVKDLDWSILTKQLFYLFFNNINKSITKKA